MDHCPPSIPFATWLCCFSHNLIELLPYPLDLDWPCDLLWPTKCGKVTVPVMWSGYKGFAFSCSVAWIPATTTWTNPGSLLEDETTWRGDARHPSWDYLRPAYIQPVFQNVGGQRATELLGSQPQMHGHKGGQRKHPHYLKMHDWEVMLTVFNLWISGDISTVFPDSNLTCLILTTRIISSKHKLDHNILLNIQQWFRFQSPYRARFLKKDLSQPAYHLPLCFPLWLSPHSLFWIFPGLLRVCTLPQLCALASAQHSLSLAIHLAYSSSFFRSWLKLK